MRYAFALAIARAGSSSAARIAIIAITTSSSINVNPADEFLRRASIILLFFLMNLLVHENHCGFHKRIFFSRRRGRNLNSRRVGKLFKVIGQTSVSDDPLA